MARALTDGDSAKIANMGFVCALLVVSIHLGFDSQSVGLVSGMVWYVVRWIFAIIAVPFFFTVSGFFIARHSEEIGWWRSALRKRVVSLLVPFLIWNALGLLLLVAVPFVKFVTQGGQWPMPIGGTLAWAFGLNLFGAPANGPLWYVRFLLMLTVLSPCIVIGVKKLGVGMLVLVSALYLIANPAHVDVKDFWLSPKWIIFWRNGFSLEGLLYFTLGVFICLNKFKMSRRTMLCMGACGMLLGFARMGMKMHGVQDCGYLIPLTIPMVMIGVWAIIPDKVWRKSIVGMTFGIYVVHINMIAIFNITQKHFFAQSNAYVVLMVVKYAFALAASMGCVWLLRRMMPRFAALAFGGR